MANFYTITAGTKIKVRKAEGKRWHCYTTKRRLTFADCEVEWKTAPNAQWLVAIEGDFDVCANAKDILEHNKPLNYAA